MRHTDQTTKLPSMQSSVCTSFEQYHHGQVVPYVSSLLAQLLHLFACNCEGLKNVLKEVYDCALS